MIMIQKKKKFDGDDDDPFQEKKGNCYFKI